MDTEQQIEELKKRIEQLENESGLTYRQNLRLNNALQKDKVYYVADSSGGTVTRKLTFKDGILTLES